MLSRVISKEEFEELCCGSSVDDSDLRHVAEKIIDTTRWGVTMLLVVKDGEGRHWGCDYASNDYEDDTLPDTMELSPVKVVLTEEWVYDS